MDSGSVDSGKVAGGVESNGVSAEMRDAAMLPQRDRVARPADAGRPPSSNVGVTDPALQAPVDAGQDQSPIVDADTLVPAPVCGPGAFEGPSGSCYVIGGSELAWLDAEAECRALGAGWDLAAVHDAATNAFLAGLFSGEAWIGGSDANVEGEWHWVRDGVEFWRGDALGAPVAGAFNNWNSDEPNGDESSDCVRMVATTTRWADLECEELRRAWCEGPKI
jgi:hypothetical protein